MIYYIKNKIEFKNLKLNRFFLRKTKNKVFDDYNLLLGQISNFKLNKINIYNHFKWNNSSSFWFNNIFKKDTEGDNDWAKKIFILYILKENRDIQVTTDDIVLYNLIRKNFYNVKINFINKSIFSRFIYNLRKNIYFNGFYFILINISFFFILKIAFKSKFKFFNKSYTWVRVLYPVNSQIIKNRVLDRNFYKNYFYEKNFMSIVKLRSYDRMSFCRLLSNLKLLNKAKNFVLIDSYIQFNDIFKIVTSNFKNYKKSLFLFKNQKFLRLLKVNNINIDLIIYDLWFSSFHKDSNFSNELDGYKHFNFFKKFNLPQTYLTYGEFFISNRPIYQTLKKINHQNFIASIQHNYNYKYYSTAYNSQKIFDFKNNNLCPYPDLFFVQGKHYYDILKIFYPKNKIHILGNQKNLIKKSNSRTFKSKKTKNSILIATSIVDFYQILDFFDCKNINFNRLKIDFKPHPTIKNENPKIKFYKEHELSNYSKLISNHINIYSSLNKYDLLICANSNLILEARDNYNISTICLQRPEDFDHFDNDNKITFIQSKKDLTNFLNKFNRNYKKKELNNKYYYFKFNKKNYERSLNLLKPNN